MFAEEERAFELIKEEFRKTGKRPLVTSVGQLEFVHDEELVMGAMLEARNSPNGRIPPPEEIMQKRLLWIADVRRMDRWYEFILDYPLRPDEMK